MCVLQIKTGAPCRSERLAKYNQLMRSVAGMRKREGGEIQIQFKLTLALAVQR